MGWNILDAFDFFPSKKTTYGNERIFIIFVCSRATNEQLILHCMLYLWNVIVFFRLLIINRIYPNIDTYMPKVGPSGICR